MHLSTVIASLVFCSCVLASNVLGQANTSARTDAEREFMRWDSTLPPRTLDGYHTGLFCFVANDVAQVISKKAGDDAEAHRYELGSEKSWIFARRLGEQLGMIESDVAKDSVEIRELANDDTALLKAIDRCHQVGLVYDERHDSSPRPETGGPNRDNTQAAIDQKFARWSASWAVDQYLSGTAHIDDMQCSEQGCLATGRFSFSRGGAVLTIAFTAQVRSVGDNEYALGRLCYNDTTTGMSDCVD